MKRSFIELQQFNRTADDYQLIGTRRTRHEHAELLNLYLQQLYLRAPTWHDLSHAEIEAVMLAFEGFGGCDTPAWEAASSLLVDLFGLEGEEAKQAWEQFRFPNQNYGR